MAQCMFPYSVERKIYHSQEDKFVKVPCGKCPECLKRRSASWSHRLEMESLLWSKMMFVTMTYHPDHCPVSPNGFMTLKKDDVTRFLKRLRKRIGKFRYYLVGEYGTQNKRPHYHMILFCDSQFADEFDVLMEWRDVRSGGKLGECYFGKVEPRSIRYTVGYYDKGDWRPYHGRDDRVPEYSVMSNAIGRSFLTPEMVAHIRANPERPYIYDGHGHKIAIPRYYRKRIFDYVGSDALVANHPSLLVHRDEMLEEKAVRAEVTAKLMADLPQPEETPELIGARKEAIRNYRNSKKKGRK